MEDNPINKKHIEVENVIGIIFVILAIVMGIVIWNVFDKQFFSRPHFKIKNAKVISEEMTYKIDTIVHDGHRMEDLVFYQKVVLSYIDEKTGEEHQINVYNDKVLDEKDTYKEGDIFNGYLVEVSENTYCKYKGETIIEFIIFFIFVLGMGLWLTLYKPELVVDTELSNREEKEEEEKE